MANICKDTNIDAARTFNRQTNEAKGPTG